MRVAVIGAGVAGLAGARALTAAGFDVVVFEERDDVGGVWSASRRYPGLRTQNDKGTYAFSDAPLPPESDQYPTAETVQRYLADFAERHGLDRLIELRTRVVRAVRTPDDGWELDVRSAGGLRQERFDWLVVASGLESTPHTPRFAGAEEFTAHGGVILAPSALGDGAVLRGRDVVVVGYGKSAADTAVAALGTARSVTVVARRVLWKLPLQVGRLSFQQLVLSRLGEHLLWAPYRTPVGRVLRKVGRPLRRLIVGRLERVIVRDHDLPGLDLVPRGTLETFTHLATPGFLDAVRCGDLPVHGGASVVRLVVDGVQRRAVLSDDASVPADVIVAATGFDQDLGFMSDEVRRALLTDDGELRLYLHTLPERQAGLAFLGWTNSFRSPISAELQAVWLVALLLGRVTPPTAADRARHTTVYQLTHQAAAARGRPQISAGVSIPDLDQWLEEAGVPVSGAVRRRELLRPLDPAAYAGVLDRLLQSVSAPDRAPVEPPVRR